MTFRARTGLSSRKGQKDKYWLKYTRAPPLIFSQTSLTKLHLDRMFLVTINKPRVWIKLDIWSLFLEKAVVIEISWFPGRDPDFKQVHKFSVRLRLGLGAPTMLDSWYSLLGFKEAMWAAVTFSRPCRSRFWSRGTLTQYAVMSNWLHCGPWHWSFTSFQIMPSLILSGSWVVPGFSGLLSGLGKRWKNLYLHVNLQTLLLRCWLTSLVLPTVLSVGQSSECCSL